MRSPHEDLTSHLAHPEPLKRSKLKKGVVADILSAREDKTLYRGPRLLGGHIEAGTDDPLREEKIQRFDSVYGRELQELGLDREGLSIRLLSDPETTSGDITTKRSFFLIERGGDPHSGVIIEKSTATDTGKDLSRAAILCTPANLKSLVPSEVNEV